VHILLSRIKKLTKHSAKIIKTPHNHSSYMQQMAKIWPENRKIPESNSDNKSDSFKKELSI